MEIDGINNHNSRQKTFSNFQNKQNNQNHYPDNESPAGESLISSSVKHINNYYKKFQSEKNSFAQSGLDAISQTFANDPDELTNFIMSAEELKTGEGGGSFEQLFELIGKMKEKGLNFQRWLKIFNSLDNMRLKMKFISSSSKIISEDTNPEELKKLYNGFLDKVSSVQSDKNLSKAQKNIILESYFASIYTAKGPLSQGGMQNILLNAVNTKASN
jgi:hypothetical protein